jgi:hypothetical protein
MRIETGQCLCGGIKFEAQGEPLWVAHCHCHSCRRNTGAPVTTFVGYPLSERTYTSGQHKTYSSSPGVRRSFCPDCGTPLCYESDGFPGEIHLYISTLDAPERFNPQLHVHIADQIPWLNFDDGLPRYTGFYAKGEHV